MRSSPWLAILWSLVVAPRALAAPMCDPTFPSPPPGGGCNSIGDPVDIVYGTSIDKSVDISIPGTTGSFTFERMFLMRDQSWSFDGTPEMSVRGMPVPFGHFEEDSLHWWHNYFSYVTVPTDWTYWNV